MNRKYFLSLCMALVLAPALMAQTESDAAHWQFAQALPMPVPARPITRRSNLTNGPAAAKAAAARAMPAMPTVPMAAAPPSPGTASSTAGQKPGAARDNGEVADITYNFPGIPIKQLLDIYADLVGRTLLRATSGPEAVPDSTTIVLNTQSKLTRSEAIVALETILGMNGVTIVPIGDKFAKVVTEAVAPQSGGMISTNSKTIPEAGKFVTQIVQVKYTDPTDLVKALDPFSKTKGSIIVIPSTQTLILRDYAENVARMMEMVEKIDVLTPNSIKPEVIPIKYALASDIASALSALGASGGTSVGKSTSGANFKSSGTGVGGGGFGGTGGIGGAGGSSGFGNSYPGQSGSSSAMGSAATSGRSSFQQNLSSIVKNAAGGAGQFQLFGMTKIIADERTNSLLVFANDEDMKMIKIIIAKLDVVLAQVLIDAIVMEINLTETSTLGVSYGTTAGRQNEFMGTGGLNNLSSAASSFLGGTSTNASSSSSGINSTLANLPGSGELSFFGKYGQDINLVLEAVAGNSRINVLSRPRIQTSHAVEADLFIGNTVPYVTGTYNYGYGSGPSSQYTQLEVGITLQVTPLINPDGLVVMDIKADVEQLGPSVQIEGVGGVPTTTERRAGAKVAVRSGETIVLGGFISDSRSTSDSGVPYLKDIPWLGNLFKSSSVNNQRTELIMLMRPTVLPTPEVAAIVATEERNKLSGVKQAELEIRKDEARRNLKIEQDLAKDAAKEAEAEKKAAKKHKSGAPDPSTNTIPISTIPPIEDQ
ncbi:MAG: secretin N-terminal domain-containing protein [Verrucomicrobiota bacterium]|jgi:general secretion pathway protein D